MINSVTIYNNVGESITMNLRNPEESGFLIRYIDGLGPPKGNIEMTEMASMDGAFYNSSRAISRNIVFSLIFRGNDIEDLRQKSYKYFPLRKEVTIVIEEDSRTCQTIGYVESNVPEIFTSMAGANISIRCPSSFLYSTENNITIFDAIESLFEFPFSNESLTEKLIEFSLVHSDPVKNIVYNGDVEVGILITIHAMGTIENIDIYNTETNENISIDTDKLTIVTGEALHLGDDIIISTVKGNKYAKLIRDGEETNILNCLNQFPDWFQLQKGDNIFTYTAEVGETEIKMTIENQIVYEGI